LLVVEPTPCDDTSVVVVYDWPESDYTMSMTAKDYYGSCGPFATTDLKKMLLGSGKMWNSTCTKVIPHTLVIEPTVECRGDQWRVQFVAFKLDAAKMVEVYVDDEKVISVRCSISVGVNSTRYSTIDVLCGQFDEAIVSRFLSYFPKIKLSLGKKDNVSMTELKHVLNL